MYRIAVAIVLLAAGCVSQPKAEIATEVQTAVRAEVQPVIAAINDQSERTLAATQKGLLAVQHNDNSSSDKVVNRIMVVSLVGLAAVYPVGKLIWLFGPAACQRLFRRTPTRTLACTPARSRARKRKRKAAPKKVGFV